MFRGQRIQVHGRNFAVGMTATDKITQLCQQRVANPNPRPAPQQLFQHTPIVRYRQPELLRTVGWCVGGVLSVQERVQCRRHRCDGSPGSWSSEALTEMVYYVPDPVVGGLCGEPATHHQDAIVPPTLMQVPAGQIGSHLEPSVG